eukprot:4584810-Prymnesium_polylepis.1
MCPKAVPDNIYRGLRARARGYMIFSGGGMIAHWSQTPRASPSKREHGSLSGNWDVLRSEEEEEEVLGCPGVGSLVRTVFFFFFCAQRTSARH